MKSIQEPPFSVQLELTEGCNLRCPFCGINGIRTKQRTYDYMTTAVAKKTANAIARAGWTARCEFAMHGEPTMNPQANEIIDVFRKYLPNNYFLMETNGSGFLAKTPELVTERVVSYFKAGLDTVALDQYQNVPWADLARMRINRTVLASNEIEFYEYPRDKAGSPHSRSQQRRFVIIAPIDLAKSGTHSSLNNHCGSGAPLDTSLIHTRCAKPFREISIRWNGDVCICCNDWSGLYRIGNTVETPIAQIWQSERFYAARQKLLHYQRDFDPCLGCTATSYRTGLLPDKYGKRTLPAPDARTTQILRQAVAGGPVVPYVDRGWTRDSSLVQIITPNRLV